LGSTAHLNFGRAKFFKIRRYLKQLLTLTANILRNGIYIEKEKQISLRAILRAISAALKKNNKLWSTNNKKYRRKC